MPDKMLLSASTSNLSDHGARRPYCLATAATSSSKYGSAADSTFMRLRVACSLSVSGKLSGLRTALRRSAPSSAISSRMISTSVQAPESTSGSTPWSLQRSRIAFVRIAKASLTRRSIWPFGSSVRRNTRDSRPTNSWPSPTRSAPNALSHARSNTFVRAAPILATATNPGSGIDDTLHE